jgi:signal transduction histidine kinase
MNETSDTILIVDDIPDNIDILVEKLKDRYRLKVATDGLSALRLAAAPPPDLILMDIMMPETDGLEVCRRLKADPATKDVPVIFISGLKQAADKVAGLRCGGVDYITKPFQCDEVLARVETHLELQRLRREQERQNRELADKNQAIQKNYERLQQLEQQRDNLVHMVVHDMRSPLMGLDGGLELLREELADSLNDTQREDLRMAMEASKQLIQMTDSLLDVSRLESGAMPLERKNCDLRDIVTRAIEQLGLQVKEHSFRYDPPPQPMVAFCDYDVTVRIVSNLVGNSLKFTPSGDSVRVALASDDATVRVSVIDTGPGIPQDSQQSIFDKFGQVKTRQQGQKHSAGLGLTFCKLAVDAQGGRIGLESEVGLGSTFWFILPVPPKLNLKE